jgi:hypothetical protein
MQLLSGAVYDGEGVAETDKDLRDQYSELEARLIAAVQRQQIAEYREQLRRELAVLHTRVAPPAGNRISLRGRVFTMPDGSTHLGPIAAVILNWRSHNQYWAVPYDPNRLEDPICWAVSRTYDELAPSPDAPERQAERCNNCPKNVFGSAPNRKAKSCRNSRRLAIVPPDATPETEPMILSASPTAISAFESYVIGLAASEGKLPVEVVTHIAFKPDAEYPTLVFGKPKPLTDKQLAVMMTLRAKAQPMLDLEGLGLRAEGDVPW